ncbi:MAG: VOC family protein [Planctomycetes bacterium]|nr:VOC family protein [Planctomycetota bacterium]
MKTRVALITLFAILFSSLAFSDHHLKGEREFTKPTIDIGCVVSDIDASVKFYTEAIGFKATGGFKVSPGMASDAGLTDNKALDVMVLTLGEGDGATSLKLMQVQGRSKKLKNDYIDTTLGFSYITIFVTSTDAAMARLKKAGVKPIAKGPVTLPADLDSSMALTIVRDPDGNLVELLGPKPQ